MFYRTWPNTNISHSFHSIPNTLIKLLNWVTNDKAFNAGDNTLAMQTNGLRTSYEQIECIVAISRNMLRLFILASPYKYIAVWLKKFWNSQIATGCVQVAQNCIDSKQVSQTMNLNILMVIGTFLLGFVP